MNYTRKLLSWLFHRRERRLTAVNHLRPEEIEAMHKSASNAVILSAAEFLGEDQSNLKLRDI